MCGRFILQGPWAEMHDMYNLIRPEDQARNVQPRYNIAPHKMFCLFITVMVKEGFQKAVGGLSRSGPKKYPNGRRLTPQAKRRTKNPHSGKRSKANVV